jgi:ureidoacrylate peracid hydrolase
MTKSTLVLIDVQNEYFTPGRPFYLQGGAPSLANIGKLLSHARDNGWHVIHVQHLQDGSVFSKDGEYGRFVDGFAPTEGEAHIVKSKLSSYTNAAYGPLIDLAAGRAVLVAGYGSTMCCLATIVSGALSGHRYTFVQDASWARAPSAAFTEAEVHRHATATLGIHAVLSTTDAVLGADLSAQAAE